MASIQAIYDQYLAAGGSGDATSFGVWLIRHAPGISSEKKPVRSEESVVPVDSMAAILVGRMERFIHVESKLALRKIGINNTDEFALMSTLYFMGETTKTALLKQCLFEITTGSQMLKRLKNDGYIAEKNNPDDGRSSLIALSARGRKKLIEAFGQLNQIRGLTEGLTEEQKHALVSFLHQLDHTHSNRQEIKTVRDVIQSAVKSN